MVYLDPAAMAVDCVGGKTDEFDAAFGELWFKLRKRAELCCADRGVIFGVGEENNPFVTDESGSW